MYEKDYAKDILEQNLYDMFLRLTAISKQYNLQIVLENDAISSYFSQSANLHDLFKEFSSIKACLDIGRLNLKILHQLSPSLFRSFKNMGLFAEAYGLFFTNARSRNSKGFDYYI